MEPKKQKITFTCTTFNRLDLFIKSMDSFLGNCMDLDLIGEWIIGDDGSSRKDLAAMKHKYPFLKIHPNRGVGQAANINWLFRSVKTEWCFHSEDDWLFIKKDNLLRKLLSINDEDALVRNMTLRNWVGNIRKGIKHPDLEYNLHCFNPGSRDWNRNKLTNECWPGYSLFGMHHMPTVRCLGQYNENMIGTREWDRPIADQYRSLGLRVANLVSSDGSPYVLHMGEGNSAYKFRGEPDGTTM